MMDLFQEMVANGGYFINPAYNKNGMPILLQDHLPISMDAVAAFSRPDHQHHHHHHHHEVAEGMDDTTLLQASTPICSDSIAINPSSFNTSNFCDANLAIGLNTNSSTSGRKQFCEISNVGCMTAPCKVTRRSWQEALSGSDSTLLVSCTDVKPRSAEEISTSILNSQRDMKHPLELTSVEKILNLQHIQGGLITSPDGTDPSTHLVNPSTLITNSGITKLPLEEPLIAADTKKGMPTWTNPNYGESFLTALSQGNEAFFKQQLVVPMEGYCRDDSVESSAAAWARHGVVFEDIEAHCVDALNDLELVRQKYKNIQQHGSDHELNIRNMLQSINKQLKWGPHEEGSAVKYHKITGKDDDDENVRASQDSTTQNRNCSWETNARRVLGHVNCSSSALPNAVSASLDSKKRSLPDLQGSACYNHMAHSKRAHLGPRVKDSTPRHSASSSTSLSTSTLIDGSAKNRSSVPKPVGKRSPLGPALNTNLKPRARQGTANDPQTVAARNRRERINARLKVLQELVPNGSKVDLVTMLEKAINYVKFLQLQLRVLSNDELWDGKQQDDVEKVAMQHAVLISKSMEEDETHTACDRPPPIATSCSTILSTTTSTAQHK